MKFNFESKSKITDAIQTEINFSPEEEKKPVADSIVSKEEKNEDKNFLSKEKLDELYSDNDNSGEFKRWTEIKKSSELKNNNPIISKTNKPKKGGIDMAPYDRYK